MTSSSSVPSSDREWYSAFPPADLAALRAAIPAGIHTAQARSGRAQTEFADGNPDEERHVYGVAMSNAVPRDLGEILRELPSYREVPIPRTSRHLMHVGTALIFPIRVGEAMRRNRKQLWLRAFSPTRQQYFEENSSTRRERPDLALFDEPATKPDPDAAHFLDALNRIEDEGGRSELFVPFYSSSPLGVGQIMWAPARLEGRYLHFTDPETLTYRKTPNTAAQITTRPQPVGGFSGTPRPRTVVTRRPKDKPGPSPEQNQ